MLDMNNQRSLADDLLFYNILDHLEKRMEELRKKYEINTKLKSRIKKMFLL